MKNYVKIIIFCVLLTLFIAVDLITKSFFDGKILDGIKGLFGINGTIHNYGAGFSILKNATVFFIILAVMFICAFIVYEVFTRKKSKHFIYYLGASMILGGTIGNAIDRISFGYVRDFINLEFMNFPVFNLADAFLTIGVIFIAIYLLFIYEKEDKKYKANVVQKK